MKNLLLIFVFLYALFYNPWEQFVYSLSKGLFLLLFTLAILLYFLWLRMVKKILIEQKTYRAEIYIALFLVLIVLSTAFSVSPIDSMIGETNRFEGLLAFFAYITLFLFAFRFTKATDSRSFFCFTLFSAIPVAIYGILQHFQIDFLPRPIHMQSTNRSFAFFGNPNFFGAYLSIMLPIVMSLFFAAKRKSETVISLIYTSILFVAMIYSLTRSAWLGAFVSFGLLTLFVIWKHRTLWKRWILLSMVLLVLLIGINITENNSFLNRFNSMVHDAQRVVTNEDIERVGSNRMYIWQKATPLIKDFFWLGSGPDTLAMVFPYNAEEFKEYFGSENVRVDKAHNEYLHMAVTLGIPALLIYLLFLYEILRNNWKAMLRLKDQEQIILMGLFAMSIGYLVQAFFNISVITVTPYFWIFLGLSYQISQSTINTKTT